MHTSIGPATSEMQLMCSVVAALLLRTNDRNRELGRSAANQPDEQQASAQCHSTAPAQPCAPVSDGVNQPLGAAPNIPRPSVPVQHTNWQTHGPIALGCGLECGRRRASANTATCTNGSRSATQRLWLQAESYMRPMSSVTKMMGSLQERSTADLGRQSGVLESA